MTMNFIIRMKDVTATIFPKLESTYEKSSNIPVVTKKRTRKMSRRGLISVSGEIFFPSSERRTPERNAAIEIGMPSWVKIPIDMVVTKIVARIFNSCEG